VSGVDLLVRGGRLVRPRGSSDADLVIVDVEREWTIRAAELHSKSRITPFEGMVTRGRPVATLGRGRAVMRDGELVGAPGWGRDVRLSGAR